MLDLAVLVCAEALLAVRILHRCKAKPVVRQGRKVAGL
jgi:hypothetical protein